MGNTNSDLGCWRLVAGSSHTGEVGLVDKHVSISPSAQQVGVVTGGGQVRDCSIVVIVHAQSPVVLQLAGRDGVVV